MGWQHRTPFHSLHRYKNLCRSVLFRESDVAREASKALVAAERIKEMNPNVKVQVISGDVMYDVGLGVFRRMDVIIGCLDNRIARLYINVFFSKLRIIKSGSARRSIADGAASSDLNRFTG